MLEIVAQGTPVQQGSKSARVIPNKQTGGHRAVVYEDSSKTKPWRHKVHGAALVAVQRAGTSWVGPEGRLVPLRVTLTFVFIRPKSSKRAWPTVKPDIDKLTRAVLDSLTSAGVYADDSQVCALEVQKEYGLVEGVRVVVEPVGDAPRRGLTEGWEA